MALSLISNPEIGSDNNDVLPVKSSAFTIIKGNDLEAQPIKQTIISTAIPSTGFILQKGSSDLGYIVPNAGQKVIGKPIENMPLNAQKDLSIIGNMESATSNKYNSSITNNESLPLIEPVKNISQSAQTKVPDNITNLFSGNELFIGAIIILIIFLVT